MPDAQAANIAWLSAATLWVYFMHAGFGFFEAGMCREKNTVDTLYHNLMILVVTVGIIWLVGFGLIFGAGNDWIGISGFAPDLITRGEETFPRLAAPALPLAVAFAFVMAYSDTPATLIAGTGAERIQLGAVAVFTVVISGFIFPMVARWTIGDGWLTDLTPAFYDTGSAFVHLCGGACALAMALMLGPRRERFKDGRFPTLRSEDPMEVSSMPLVFLGAFMLWMGFIAFNAGFALVADRIVGLVVVNTVLGPAAATVATMLGDWWLTGNAKLRTAVVGLLTGNVAVTSPAGVVAPWGAAVVGIASGIATLLAIRMWARIRVDDPTEYLTMNLVGGFLGLLGVGLLASPQIIARYGEPHKLDPGWIFAGPDQLWIELLGGASILIFAFVVALLTAGVLRYFGLLRVSLKEEAVGQDVATHGEEAYENHNSRTSKDKD